MSTFDSLSDSSRSIFGELLHVATDVKDDLQNLAKVIESDDATMQDVSCMSICEDVTRNISSQHNNMSDDNQRTTDISVESLRMVASYVRQVGEAVEMLGDARSNFVAMIDDICCASVLTDLTNQNRLEQQQQEEVSDIKLPPPTPARKRALMDETGVFELMEQQVAMSDDEIAQVKATYELKLKAFLDEAEDLRSQLGEVNAELDRSKSELKEAKDHSADLVEELNAFKTASSMKYSALERDYSSLSAELDHSKMELKEAKDQSADLVQELNRIKTDSSKEYSALEMKYSNLSTELGRSEMELKEAKDQSTDLLRQLSALKMESSNEYSALQSKYSNLSETVNHLVEKYIPKYVFPMVLESLPRMAHVLATLSERCPWLFSALVDENLDPNSTLPNPISLEIKHKLAVEQLVLERNNLQDKLHHAAEEFRTSDEAHALYVDSATKQLESAKQKIEKLEDRITRYKHYMGQMWSMYQSSQGTSAKGQASDSPNFSCSSQLSNEPHQAYQVTGSSTAKNVTHQSTAAENIVSPSTSHVGSPPNSGSSSMLSRVGQAVSAITTALISPRRTATPTHSPKHTSSTLPTNSDSVERTTSSSHGSSVTAVDAALPCRNWNSKDDVGLNQPVSSAVASFRQTAVTASPVYTNLSAEKCIKTAAPVTSRPFIVPNLPPRYVAPHPTIGKRRPLSELPRVSETVERDFVSHEPKVFSPIVRSHSTSAKLEGSLPGDSFIQVNPLAESTSAVPFSHNTQKRTRFEAPTYNRPTPGPMSMPPATTINRPYQIPSTRLPSPRSMNRAQLDRCNSS